MFPLQKLQITQGKVEIKKVMSQANILSMSLDNHGFEAVNEENTDISILSLVHSYINPKTKFWVAKQRKPTSLWSSLIMFICVKFSHIYVNILLDIFLSIFI